MQPILSGGLVAALTMVFTAALIIALVRYGMLNGLRQIASAQKWSAKTRGQVTGYATSVPEFVCLLAAGLSGVWDAGLWNIASSNMINTGLMLAAVLYYGQHKELFNRRFFDEIGSDGKAVACAEISPDVVDQGVSECAGDIIDTDQGWIAQSSRASATDDGNPALMAAVKPYLRLHSLAVILRLSFFAEAFLQLIQYGMRGSADQGAH